jgi:hypothetical protein
MATSKTTTGTTGHTNPDAITGAPKSHPGATGIGSVSGAATGAALGAIGGPVGALIGGVAGAIVGGGVGHTAGEAHDPSDAAYWRDEYKNRPYFDRGVNYDRDVAPAYQFGGSLHEAQSAGAVTQGAFESVEDRARQNWEKSRGTSSMSYDQARGPIRDAYTRRQQTAGQSGGATGNSGQQS